MEPSERIDIDRFDAWLDQLARGIASPVPADADDLVQAADWLHDKGQRVIVSPLFIRQLHAQLRPAIAEGPDTLVPPITVLQPQARASDRALSGPPHRALIAAAAAILIAVPVLILLVRSFTGGLDDATIPAPTNGLAQSGTPVTCSVEQPSTLTISGSPEHEAVLFANSNDWYPNVPGVGGPVLYQEDLPTGPAASPHDLVKIQQTLATLAACLYAQDYAGAEALFSDDSLRRSGSDRGDDVQGTPDPAFDGQATPPNPLRNLTEPVTPVILSCDVLPDGRIGVLLEQDVTGFGLKQYFILVHSGRGWLIDEDVHVTSRVKPSPEPSMVTFEITAIDLLFEPSRIEMPAGVDVTIIVSNEGLARKTFVIPELDVDAELPAGESISVIVNTPKGVYEFYSDVPGQRAAGLEGLIIVVPDS